MRGVFNVEVKIPPSITGLIRRLSPQGQGKVVSQMGRDVACRFGRFFNDASKTRHTVAQRFNVKPTGIMEFNDTYPPQSRGGGEITSRRDGNSAVVKIKGLPFLNRAYGSVRITPRRARYLTIPINRASVHHSAAEMESLGYVLFCRSRRSGGKASAILYGKRGGRVYALYALSKGVTLPKDAGLMPTENEIGAWAASSARRYFGL